MAPDNGPSRLMWRLIIVGLLASSLFAALTVLVFQKGYVASDLGIAAVLGLLFVVMACWLYWSITVRQE